MRASSSAESEAAPVWVGSMGGPLVVVPTSVLDAWGGCTLVGMMIGDGEVVDDYDRACDVEGLAGVIAVGRNGAQALVLADEPATSCYLPAHRAFLRWLGADSEAELIAAAEVVLADPATEWEEGGTWRTDGPAVLMDSANAGADLKDGYPDGRMPEQAPVPLPPERWTVRSVHTRTDDTWVGLVQLLPAIR